MSPWFICPKSEYGAIHFPMSDLNNGQIADQISKFLSEKKLTFKQSGSKAGNDAVPDCRDCHLPAHLGTKVVIFFAMKSRKARMRGDRC
jgi:hypothetical protein